MRTLICLVGPTASGKSSLALDLAKRFNTEIINFDSMNFYKELNIGVAKPSQREKEEIKHHLIDCASIDHPWTANVFTEKATDILSTWEQGNPLPILVGGSGFYLKAFLTGMIEDRQTPPEIRKKSASILQQKGPGELRRILEQLDPASAEQIHPNDTYRNQRALEYLWTNNHPISQRKKTAESNHLEFTHARTLGLRPIIVYLDWKKEELNRRIEKRVDHMLANGLFQEVQEIRKRAPESRLLKSVGYRQVCKFLEQNTASEQIDYAECREKIVVATRQLAKSQRTWFQKIPTINFHPKEQQEELFRFVATCFDR